jgi:hypothetical protein
MSMFRNNVLELLRKISQLSINSGVQKLAIIMLGAGHLLEIHPSAAGKERLIVAVSVIPL